jgi:hypothetical protein
VLTLLLIPDVYNKNQSHLAPSTIHIALRLRCVVIAHFVRFQLMNVNCKCDENANADSLVVNAATYRVGVNETDKLAGREMRRNPKVTKHRNQVAGSGAGLPSGSLARQNCRLQRG